MKILRLRSAKDLILFSLAIAFLVFSLFRVWGQWRHSANIEKNIPTLVFSYWWEDKNEILERIKNEFQELYPGIKISLDFRPYEDLRGGGKGEPWDIIALDQLWVPLFLDQEWIENDEFPLLNFFHPLFYNIDILRNAGFSRPPRTRTEFLAQLRAAANPAAGRYGIALALEPDNVRGIYRDVYSWLWAGGLLLEDLETPVQANRVSAETRALIETLEFLALLQNEGILFPGPLSLGEHEKRRAFLEGRIAFMIGSAEDMEILRQELGEGRFDYTAIPAPDAYTGKPIFGSGVWSLAIAKESEHKEEAHRFIAFLLENSSLFAEGWAIPGNGNHMQPSDPFYSKAWEFYVNGDLIKELPMNGQEEFSREAIFREEIINLFQGGISAAEAAGAIQRRMQGR